ncbi:MAG TPA: nucleotide exchange factor GrpE [Bacillota bacterium]|nr:nucleotide exchange factor GrpE [Bacillota bacterium]
MTDQEKETCCEEAMQQEEPTVEAPAEQDEVAKLKKENEELQERLLRLRADFDNFRKRSRQQLAESRSMAIESFAVLILPVLDNLQRALAAAKGSEEGDFLTGVEMIHRQLLDVLAQEEIRPIEALGQKFDPLLHEAVAAEETEDAPEGTVLEEFLRGYLIGNRVLRYSKVKVAKAKKTGKDEVENE